MPCPSVAHRAMSLAALLPALCAADAPAVNFHAFRYSGSDAVFEQPLPAGHYRNPILAGFHPDPSLLRVGDDYYLVTSSFAYFPGLPVLHSRDLVNWRLLGHAIDRPDQLRYDGLGVSRGLFAPALSHHQGTYYLTTTMIDAGGNLLLTARDPAGPWSDPVWLGFEGIDPSLFFDDDGRAWMVNNGAPEGPPRYSGHRAIWIQQFDIASNQLFGPRQVLVDGGVVPQQRPVWIEGPHIVKRRGWYYLTAAEGGTSTQHSQVVLRSRAVTGPYTAWERNPILTQRDLDSDVAGAVTCTGHAEMVIGPDDQWWAAFLGCRPFDGQHWLTGRETFLLPVRWTDDDWPVILPPGQRVPAIVKGPSPAAVADVIANAADPALNGNVSIVDHFDQGALSPAWLMLRAPRQAWWHLTPQQLSLTPRAERLSGRGNPSFMARRVQHARFEASTVLDVPALPGVSAGLALFQSEARHYYLAVRRSATGLSVLVEKVAGAAAEVVARADLPSATERIELRISADRQRLAFAYALQPGEWLPLLADADALAVSVQAAGGGLHFTGAVLGLHARTE